MTNRTKKNATRIAKTSKTSMAKGSVHIMNPDTFKDISINNFASMALKIYGSYVVEERAIPEHRDGLKPVHRALLWAMQQLNLTYTAKTRKSAKVVGDTIGSYHPHGDGACYDAMVTLANASPKLVRGEGNWGSPVDGAAAYRYTEARLSVFSKLFLLDSGYLNVVPMQQNFDNTAMMPVHLPALLPVMLMMGNPTAPAYGVRAGNPPFAIEGIVKLLRGGLRGKAITEKACIKNLEVHYPYGSIDVTSADDFAELIKTGRGSMAFTPVISATWEHKNKDAAKKISIQSYSPGFRGASVVKQLEKINALDSVQRAYDRTGKKDKYGRSGPYGCLYIVEPKRGISEDKFFELAEKVEKILTTKEHFDLGCTHKHIDKVTFERPNVPQFINTWIKYRIKLEIDYIDYLIKEATRKLDYQELLLFAVDNRDLILKVLPKVLKAKEPDAALSKAIKKPVEYAKRILDLQIRRLASLERSAIVKTIKELKAEIKSLAKERKSPNARIEADLVERVKKYKALSPKYDFNAKTKTQKMKK